jgi:flagellar hook-associated protein 1 FlgK
MPSPFHGISLASTALRAFQRQLDVTGNNIGNVNTPGYSRQVVDLAQLPGTQSLGIHPYVLGNGVTVLTVNRIQDAFLQGRSLAANNDLGRLTTLADRLGSIQGIIGEPGPNGVASALDTFFNAWSALASNPNMPGARQLVQAAGQTLTSRVRSIYGDLDNTGQHLQIQMTQALQRVDQLSSRISQLNLEIRQRVATGESPNELLDARDVALQELSGLINISSFNQPDGTVTVYSGEMTLVDTFESHAIPKTFDVATGTLSDGTRNYAVKGGKIAGLFGVMKTVDSYKASLDDLANSLRTTINGMHATGTSPNGATGLNFFNDTVPQTGARDFNLDALILADPDNIAAGVSGAAGDGGLALSISRLRDDTTVTGLAGKSFVGFYADLVSQVGHDGEFYASAADTQKAVVQQIELQKQSVSGVSLDDEMANMLRFQRSFQAAAKALTVFDQVTEDLIGMLRR